jgi:hypothetical protein
MPSAAESMAANLPWLEPLHEVQAPARSHEQTERSEPMLLEPAHGGHGVSDPLQQPEVMAMRATFFIHHLMNAPSARHSS